MELPTTTCSICTQDYIVAANTCRSPAILNEYIDKLVSTFSPSLLEGHDVRMRPEICVICEQELLRLHKFLSLMERSYRFLHETRKLCKVEPPDEDCSDNSKNEQMERTELIEVKPDVFGAGANFEQVIIKEEIDDEMLSEERDVPNTPTERRPKKTTTAAETPYECDYCPKHFAHRWQLRRHRKTHASVKPFRCDICSKDFLQQSVLKKHYMLHNGESRFRCDHCAKGFLEMSDLKRHRLTHTGEKPYKCDVCSKGFSQTSILKRHRITHTGEKQYKCDVCSEPFAWQTQLKRHMRVHEQRSEEKG